MVLSKYSQNGWAILDTGGNGHVFGAGQRTIGSEHAFAAPVHQFSVHGSGKNQRRIMQLAHLQKLPDHHGFQNRADSAWNHHERVRNQYEMMQASKKRAMLVRFADVVETCEKPKRSKKATIEDRSRGRPASF